MSDRETFMARWSRRKRASAQEGESAEPSAPADDAAAQAPQAIEAPQAIGAPQAVGAPQAADAPQPGEHALGAPADARASDAPASHEEASPVPQLPSIESIVAESDVRAFLAPGVPPELTRAALRRAWSADPKIRDFIGLSENSWDFNDPGAMPGFGPLELTEEIRQEISRMIGRSLGEDVPDVPGPPPPDVAEPGPEPPPGQAKSAMLASPAGAAPQPPVPDAPGQEARGQDAPVVNADGVAGASAPDRDRSDRVLKPRHGRALPQ
jgi:Protein of unknown function (DUF3306)